MILKSGNDMADVQLQLWSKEDILTDDDSYEILQEDWMELIEDEEYETPVYIVDSVVDCLDKLVEFVNRQNNMYEEKNFPYEEALNINILKKGEALKKWKLKK